VPNLQKKGEGDDQEAARGHTVRKFSRQKKKKGSRFCAFGVHGGEEEMGRLLMRTRWISPSLRFLEGKKGEKIEGERWPMEAQ